MKIANFMELSLPGNSEKFFFILSKRINAYFIHRLCFADRQLFFLDFVVGEVSNGLLMSQYGDY